MKIECVSKLHYDYLENLKVFEVKTEDGIDVFIGFVEKTNGEKKYIDALTDYVVYDESDKKSNFTILREKKLIDYLISYNKIQQVYKAIELQEIYEQIKLDLKQERTQKDVKGK